MTAEYVSSYNDAVRAERCYFCPRRSGLTTHHVVPQRKNGSDAEANLVVVCERCHRKLEAVYDQRFYERLGVGDDRGEKRSHYACTDTDCDRSAELKVQSAAGFVDWWCEEHADRVLASPGADVLESVDSGVSPRV